MNNVLKKKAIVGVVWSAALQWGTQATSLLTFIILARLLAPETFGLIALAMVFVAFCTMLIDLGFLSAIIQKENISSDYLSTAFWANIIAGFILVGLVVLLAPLAGDLLHESQLGEILVWLSFGFILYAFETVQKAILQRELRYKALAIRTLIAKISGAIVGVSMALNNFGVWSLVAQFLVDGLIGSCVLWLVSDWRPVMKFSMSLFLEMSKFGANVVGIRFTSFLDTRLDDLLIGVFLGTTALGYYSIAYNILGNLSSLINNIGAPVAFSLFSRLQNDIEKLRGSFYQAVKLTGLIAFPVYLAVVVMAPVLIPLIFGSQWDKSVPVLQALMFVGLLHAVLQYNGSIMVAMGKPSWLFYFRIGVTVSNILAFVIGMQWGIVGVAIGYAISNYMLVPISLILVRKLIDIEWKDYFRSYAVSFLASTLMVCVLLILQSVLSNTEYWLNAVIVLLSGGLVYVAVVSILIPNIRQRLSVGIRE